MDALYGSVYCKFMTERPALPVISSGTTPSYRRVRIFPRTTRACGTGRKPRARTGRGSRADGRGSACTFCSEPESALVLSSILALSLSLSLSLCVYVCVSLFAPQRLTRLPRRSIARDYQGQERGKRRCACSRRHCYVAMPVRLSVAGKNSRPFEFSSVPHSTVPGGKFDSYSRSLCNSRCVKQRRCNVSHAYSRTHTRLHANMFVRGMIIVVDSVWN